MERSRSLLTVLGRANFEKLPNDVVKKLEKVIEDVNAKFGEAKNNYNESRKTVGKLKGSRTKNITCTQNHMNAVTVTLLFVFSHRHCISTSISISKSNSFFNQLFVFVMFSGLSYFTTEMNAFN